MPTAAPTIDFPIPLGGVRPDLNPSDVVFPGLVNAENWVLRDGIFRVRPGFSVFAGTVSQRPMGYAAYLHSDGADRLVKGTTAGWWRYNAATQAWVNITGTALSGGALDQVVFRAFQKAGQTWLLGTNGANTAKKWDGLTATYADVSGSPPRARCMATAFNRVLLGNLLSGGTISPVAVDVSADKDFDAGWGNVLVVLLADTPGDIVTMLESGSLTTVIYKTDAIYVGVAQAGIVPFRFELRQPNIAGPVSPLAVLGLPDGRHIYLARDGDVKQFDGLQASSLGRNIQAYIQKTMNLDRMGRAFGWSDPERGEVGFLYPAIGATEPGIGVLIHLSSRTLWPLKFSTLRFSAGVKGRVADELTIGELVGTIGDQDLSIGEYATVVSRLLLGEIGGQSYDDVGLTDGPGSIPFLAESGRLALGSRGSWRTVHELDHLFRKASATQQVSVSLGASDYGESPAFDTPETVNVGADGPYVTGHRATGRYHSLKIEGTATQEVEWSGAVAGVAARGRR